MLHDMAAARTFVHVVHNGLLQSDGVLGMFRCGVEVGTHPGQVAMMCS